MNNDSKKNEILMRLSESGFAGFLVVLLIFVAAIGFIAFFVDQRLDSIEGHLKHEPAKDYEEPNLSDFAPQGFSEDSAKVEQSVYVPIYSHVYYLDGRPYPLAATLSIRNSDLEKPIFLRSVRYYNTKGELAKTQVGKLIMLKPLETIEFLVGQRDTSGGSGANFIVDWTAMDEVNTPVIEAVMVGSGGTQGICFHTRGVPLKSFEDKTKVGQED